MSTRPRIIVVAGVLVSTTLLSVAAFGPFAADDGGARLIPSGAAVTLLGDGSSLITGGEGADGMRDTALLIPSGGGDAVALIDPMRRARAWHSATVLPDSGVLLIGGVGAGGRLVRSFERFDPTAQTFSVVAPRGLVPRAAHSATLLTNGRVLIAGGLGADGAPLGTLALDDPIRGTPAAFTGTLTIPRYGHTATLLEDGTVLLWGGYDTNGAPLANGELVDPATQQVTFVAVWPAFDDVPLAVSTTVPVDGATEVAVDAHMTLRFSRPVAIASLTDATVSLRDATGERPVRLVPAEGGRLVFVWPQEALTADTPYTLTLDGVAGQDCQALATTAVHFRTVEARRGEAGRGAPADPSTVGTPPSASTGQTVSTTRSAPMGRPSVAAARTASVSTPLHAPAGVTAVSGQVLQLDGAPLPDVTLQIGRRSTRSDAHGRFVVPTDGCGQHCVLFIDGRSAGTAAATYGVFEDGVDVAAGQTTVLPYVIWMPVLDTAHAVTIPSPTTDDVVVTSPALPGLELHLPPQTIIRNRDGTPVTQLTITPIPVDQPPFPLPPNVDVPLYFTVQPGGAYLENWTGAGAYLVYPNAAHAIPRKRVPFWDYDPDVKGWYIYGLGRVSDDGMRIVPDHGVGFYEFTGAMVNAIDESPPTCAADEEVGGECLAPPPDDSSSQGLPSGNEDSGSQTGGEPVDLATGLFTLRKTDLYIPDILPIELTRVYRSGDDNVYRFGPGMTHLYAMFLWSAHQYTELDLIQPDGAKVHYVRISAGEGFKDAVFEHTATPTRFYKSRVAWNGDGWDLTLKDGTVYVFGANAPLQAIHDRNGNQITITRTNGQQGNITRVTSPSGRYIDFTYNTSAETIITQVTDNMGRSVQYAYDGDGQLKTVTDPNGGTTNYTYEPHPTGPPTHRLVKIKDARGIDFIQNTYGSVGKVIQQIQADTPTGAFAFQFGYVLDAAGRVTQTDVTNPRGVLRRVVVNADGYVVSDRRAVGLPDEALTTFTRQAGSGLVLETTDPLGRRSTFTYDAMGNVTSISRLAGTSNAVTTTRTYEPTFNQIATVTDPLQHATQFDYDGHGNRVSVTNALDNKTVTTYNAAGQPIAVTDPLQNQTQLTYDGGDLVAVTDPLGHTTHRFVDAVGRLIATIDPLGRRTQYAYDPLDRLTQVTDARGGVTTYTYDPNGNLLTVTDARGNTTTEQPSNMDRLAKRTDSLGRFTQYTYDLDGNVILYRDGLNQKTAFAYDDLERRTFTGFKQTISGSTTTYESTVSETYDAGNRETSITDSAYGSVTPTYDGLDRLTAETTAPLCPTPSGGMCPVSATIGYTYDVAGRRTAMSTDTALVTYTYDAANRLVRIVRAGETVQLSYDAAGRRTATVLPNGVVISYGYDAASRVTALTYSVGTTTLGNLTYSYDAVGNLVDVGGSWARTGLPQALSSAVYDAANQIATWDGTTVTYDADGRLRNDGAVGYVWNSRGQLLQLGGQGVSGTFQYDALGRRAVKEVNGATTRFVYDGVNAVSDYSATSLRAVMLTHPAADEVFERFDVTHDPRYLLRDALGSTLALTSGAAAVATTYTYEPFGGTTVAGAADGNPFQYSARENDSTGLYFYRSRYYHPRFARFISTDPPRPHSSSVNTYTYADNTPTDAGDPLGLFTVQIGGNVNIQTGPIDFSFSGGIALDDKGNIAFYSEGGGGLGVGEEFSGGILFHVSDGDTIRDLNGPFTNGSIGGGFGPDASIDQFYGLGENGQPVIGGGFTFGGGVGGGGAVTITNTIVGTPFGGRK